MNEIANCCVAASSKRKPPRRRMYHDAKLTTLLHPSNSPKLHSSDEKRCNGMDKEFTSKFHIESRAESLPKVNLSEKLEAFEPHTNVYPGNNGLSNTSKKNSTSEINKSTKTNSERVGSETRPSENNTHQELIQGPVLNDVSTRQKNEFKNPIFQKFLYNIKAHSADQDPNGNQSSHGEESPANLVTDIFGHCVAVPSKKKNKVRNKRRHTATGTNGLTIKEVEDWICNEKPATSEKVTKDDSEVLIATKITPMRRAKTLNSFEWYERRSGNKEEEESNDVNFKSQWLHEREEKKVYDSEIRSDANSEKTAGSTIDRVNDRNFSRRCDENKANSVDKTEDRILSNGINNRLSCFLSPRPYIKDTFQWRTMSQPRKSWNGVEDKEEKFTPENESRIVTSGSTYSSYIDDDDDFKCSALQQRYDTSSRSRSLYDTFLDLSNLDLDDDEESENHQNNDVTHWSDSETCENDKWCWNNEANNHSLDSHLSDRHSAFFEEELDDFSQSSARGPLEKIDEHPAEFCETDETGSNENNFNQTCTCLETDGDNQTYETATASTSVTSSVEPFTVASESSATSQISSIDEGQSDSVREGDEHSAGEAYVINDVSTSSYSQKKIVNATSSSDVSSSAKASSTKTSDSFESLDSETSAESQEYILDEDDVQFELYNSYPISDKTASLDRYQFLKQRNQNLSEAESQPIDFHSKNQTTLQSDLTAAETVTESNTNETVNSRVSLNRLYNIALSTIRSSNRDSAKIKDVLDYVEAKGIRLTDLRLEKTVKKVAEEPSGAESSLDFDVFCRVFDPCYDFIRGLLLSQVTIPGFGVFKIRISRLLFEKMQEIVNKECENTPTAESHHANYNVIMKQLRNNKPTLSLSLCTVDGQRCSFGSEDSPHPLNACATVFNYCLACRQNGIETVSYFLGQKCKPSKKTEFMLEEGEKVWNPFTKCGSILTSALLFRETALEDRLKVLHKYYQSLIGQESLCCDNLSYNYKRIYDHEEIGLAYFLSATQRLPRGTSADLSQFLDFHFQAASSAMTSETCAIGAATLANGGVCPLTGEAVLDEASVNHTLSVMKSSHKFLEIELINPQIDSISAAWSEQGSIIVVIPGVLGMTCFAHCHSASAVQKAVEYLIKKLANDFNFGVYRSLKGKRDLSKR